jgi:choline dehydrogenase
LHIHALRPAAAELASVHRYSFTIGLLRPESRGGVGLTASDPVAPPRIDLNLCQREADATALARGVEHVRALAAAIFGPERVELPPFAGVTGPALTQLMRQTAGVYFHPMGTARMGEPAHPLTVVDDTCRVIGVDQLSVVDASVIPVALRATTNLPVTMLAERAMELRG